MTTQHSLTVMQDKIYGNHKHRVHDNALQDNKGSNPLQDMIHDPGDNLFKCIHKHKAHTYYKHKSI